MDKPKCLWQELCSYDNLYLAFSKARKHKTKKDYVISFENNLEENLLLLRIELLFHIYRPKPLTSFIIKDMKLRKISKSEFRDRIVHHAVCNIIEPIFEKIFIFDSYANRKGKGAQKAIERFDNFKRTVSKNNSVPCYILKADIKKYFENVNHDILLKQISKRIKDKRIIWLIKIILSNFSSKDCGKGMPLGNLTSQFFANVYLNSLDQYVKHFLKAKHYIRYVDDFVLLHKSKKELNDSKMKISEFLSNFLCLNLHPEKSKIIKLREKFTFLGYRSFYYHRLLKRQNVIKFRSKYNRLKSEIKNFSISYDTLYNSFEGWLAYALKANTYKLRKIFYADMNLEFPGQISEKELNRFMRIEGAKNINPLPMAD